MSTIKEFFSRLFGSKNQEVKDRNGYYFYVRCKKCGAPVRIRASKTSDFERDYDTGELTLRKEIMDGGCFSLMYATIKVNAAYQVVEQSVEGGEFITWEEYNALAHPPKAETGESSGA